MVCHGAGRGGEEHRRRRGDAQDDRRQERGALLARQGTGPARKRRGAGTQLVSALTTFSARRLQGCRLFLLVFNSLFSPAKLPRRGGAVNASAVGRELWIMIDPVADNGED